MDFLSKMKIIAKYFWIIAILIIALDIVLRFWHLSYPNWQIFDEVYYPKYADTYFGSGTYFDVHPNLGKMIIAGGIYLFGNNSFGWRFFQAIFGSGLIMMIFFFALSLFKDKLTALISLVLASVCTMIFVESRLSLINIFLAFFTTLGLYLFWLWVEKKQVWLLTVSLISLALATSVKWSGLLALLAIIIYFILLVTTDKKFLEYVKSKKIFVILSILVFAGVYIGIFFLGNRSQYNFWQWHQQALNFHLTLKDTHPYQSRWWTWILDIRPIWLEFKKVAENVYVCIIEIVNLPLVWLSLVAFIYGICQTIKKKNRELIFLIITILCLYLPWILVKRVTFLYLFLPVMPFLIILSANFLRYLISKKFTIIAITTIVLVIGFFIYFYPLMTGQNVSYSSYSQHMWLKSWY